jgi:hypothetical protein
VVHDRVCYDNRPDWCVGPVARIERHPVGDQSQMSRCIRAKGNRSTGEAGGSLGVGPVDDSAPGGLASPVPMGSLSQGERSNSVCFKKSCASTQRDLPFQKGFLPLSLSAQKICVKESTSLNEGAHRNGRRERHKGGTRPGLAHRAARGVSEALIRSRKHLMIACGACVTGSVSRSRAGRRPAASPSWAKLIDRPNAEIASLPPVLLFALAAKAA